MGTLVKEDFGRPNRDNTLVGDLLNVIKSIFA